MPRSRFVTRFGSFRILAIAALIALFAGLLTVMPFTPAPAHATDAATGSGGLFVSATSRIWDTTTGRDGAPSTPMTAGQWYTVGVEGVEGMPTSGVSAVQVDFYVTNPSSGGIIHADKDGVTSPNTSVSYVNYGSASVSNGATIAVGSDGKIQVMATTSTDLRIDVQGYYTAGTTAAGGYVATTATQVATFSAVASNTYLSAFSVVGGTSPAPSSASGVMLDIQESGSHAAGYLIPYADESARPSTALYWPSTNNYDFSTAVGLNDGKVIIYVGTGGAVNLTVSVEGYYTAVSSTSSAGVFTPATARVFDSRSPSAPIASNGVSTVQVTGTAGVPSSGSGIQAVVVNIGIIAGTGASGHLQAYADNQSPGSATQQFYASTTSSIFAVVPLGADGGIKIQNSSGGTINVVVDVEGWYSSFSGAIPSGQTSTQKSLTLQGTENSGGSWVTYNYRVGTTSSFLPVPPGDVSPAPTSTSGSGATLAWQSQETSSSPITFAGYTWNLNQTLANADTAASPATNYAVSGALVQVEACFGVSATDPSPVCSMPTTVTYNPSSFGAAKDTTTVGPGSLSLLTGDFEVSSTDASATSSLDSLSVGRTLTTLTPAAASTGSTGVFGPGWTADLSGPGAGDATLKVSATAAGVDGAAQGYELFTDTDGSPSLYQASEVGSYPMTFTGVGDNAGDGVTVTKSDANTITMTDPDGTVTTWVRSGVTWPVQSVTEPGSATAATYTTSTASPTTGLVTRILGPVPAGVTCSGSTIDTTPGCRSLLLNYETLTVAGVSVERLQSISTSLPQVSGASNITAVAAYDYTSGGLLADAYDPRLPGLKTAYTYTSANRLATLTPPGQAAWSLVYDTSGRVSTVSRPDPSNGTATTTIVYSVPLTGNSNLPSMDPTTLGTWNETSEVPAAATAIFSPDWTPAGKTASTVAGTDWQYASVDYMDVNGRQINTAAYGAGTWQIGTTWYDSNGDDVSELTPGNRAQALSPTTSTDTLVRSKDQNGNYVYTSAQRANYLESFTVYNPLNLSEVTDTYGPTHPITLNGGGAPIDGRDHTGTIYDQGAPDSTVYALPTTELTDVFDEGNQVYDDGANLKITTLGYGPLQSGDTSGWTLREATTSTVQMDGTTPSPTDDLTTSTRYNASGQVIESGLPAGYAGMTSGTGTAQDTVTTYYTATGTGACVNPASAGLVCSTGPAAQPATGNPLPVTTDTYDANGNVLTQVDTAGTTVRTTTNTYDAVERQITSGITVTPTAAGGAALPVVTTGYDPNTGLQTSQSTTTGGTTSTLSKTYNSLGEMTSYTDTTGYVTNYTYDLDGRETSVNDPLAVITFGYDTTPGEHRGLLTSENLNDSSAPSTFSAAYDASGAMTTETYPSGLTATSTFDNTGAATSLSYAQNGSTWMGFNETRGVNGQIVNETSPASSQAFAYDADGRLTTVQDSVTAGPSSNCTTRQYAFDHDSNRSSLTTYAPGGSGTCSTATTASTVSSTYDQADRITNTGYQYDTLGRTTLVPAVDAQGIGQYATNTGNLAVGYYSNDMVASETQGTGTISYGLDPNQDRILTVNNGNTTTTNIYGDDSDSPTLTGTGSSSFTYNINGLDGGLAASMDQTGAVTLELANMHGDIVATAPDTTTATGITAGSYNESTEYGAPRNAATASTSYGWLGTKKRSADSLGGLTLMGVRLYNSATGRFLSTDSVPGGNANPYVYPADPLDKSDTSGKSWWRDSARWLTNSKWGKRIAFACGFAWGALGAACGGVYTAAYAVQGRWGEAAVSAVGMIGGGVVAHYALRGLESERIGSWIARRYATHARRTFREFQHYGSEWAGVAYGQASSRFGGGTARYVPHYRRWA